MNERIERARDVVSNFVEYAQTSKRALVAEGVGAVVGLSGAIAIDRPVPAIILGAVGFGSVAAGLSNLEYQGVVGWKNPLPEPASLQEQVQ